MYRNVIAAGALLFTLAACADEPENVPLVESDDEMSDVSAAPLETGEEAVARFINPQGTEIGTARLTQQADGVQIVVDLAFLQAGERGFHIHETGRCEAPGFDSAGDHFNPSNASHGTENAQGPHAGDLPNLEVETDDGTARATITNDRVTLAPGQPNSLLDADGSALIVHRRADDYDTQPSGDAGEPIACAVIEPA